MERVIVHGHDPENVVLTEVEPRKQKTLPDFLLTAGRLGIEMVDIAELVPEVRHGKPIRLFYRKEKLVPIRRIYNRAIVDEVIRKSRSSCPSTTANRSPWNGPDTRTGISISANFPSPTWIILPFHLRSLLDDWLAGKGDDRLPADREQWILKPLFSFAGKGIEFAPSDETLAAIPKQQRHEYLLQQRVHFEQVVDTPFGPTQPELRILYLWPDSGNLEPVISLVRLGRGKMMGVDHNRDQEWVGASAAFYPFAGGQ